MGAVTAVQLQRAVHIHLLAAGQAGQDDRFAEESGRSGGDLEAVRTGVQGYAVVALGGDQGESVVGDINGAERTSDRIFSRGIVDDPRVLSQHVVGEVTAVRLLRAVHIHLLAAGQAGQDDRFAEESGRSGGDLEAVRTGVQGYAVVALGGDQGESVVGDINGAERASDRTVRREIAVGPRRW